MEATVPARCELEPGDPAPWFTAVTRGNPEFNFDTAAGRYIVLSFVGAGTSPAGRAIVAFLDAQPDRFDDVDLAFFGVTGDPADFAGTGLADRVPGIRWFLDRDGAIAAAYGAGGRASVFPQTLILDPMLRVLAAIPLADPERHAATLGDALARLPRVAAGAWSAGPAPVLVLPRILEPAFCRALIDHFEAVGGVATGAMRSRGGRSVTVLDRARKRRSDCRIEDEALRGGLRGRIVRRLLPIIERAYQFTATRIERYIVACYDGGERGFFVPHRDNRTPATRHRRFAVTINLNAEEYEGGDLRFPEFGRQTYRAPTGGAVLFSCSLTHEALPVTHGRRYATLPFLYDDAGEVMRRATRDLIDPMRPEEGAPPPRDPHGRPPAAPPGQSASRP